MADATVSQKIRIVVADDHPIFRHGLCRLLAQEEDFVIVAEAQDGREVLQVLQEHEADILLLDLKMPNMGGLATLQELQVSGSQIKAIVLTASEDKNDFVQAVKFGASGTSSSKRSLSFSSRASAGCTPVGPGSTRRSQLQ